jgi:hypothetical protein
LLIDEVEPCLPILLKTFRVCLAQTGGFATDAAPDPMISIDTPDVVRCAPGTPINLISAPL